MSKNVNDVKKIKNVARPIGKADADVFFPGFCSLYLQSRLVVSYFDPFFTNSPRRKELSTFLQNDRGKTESMPTGLENLVRLVTKPPAFDALGALCPPFLKGCNSLSHNVFSRTVQDCN